MVIAGGGGGGGYSWSTKLFRFLIFLWYTIAFVIAWRNYVEMCTCISPLEGLSIEERVWQIQSNRTWLNICGKHAGFLLSVYK